MNGCPHGYANESDCQICRDAQAAASKLGLRPERPKDKEVVAHPGHYFNDARCKRCGEPIECIDVVQHMNFNLGNVVKYAWRAGAKDPKKLVEDLKKGAQYIAFEILRLGGQP